MGKPMTPAQAAQQDNRDSGGRYAEGHLADPGSGVLPGHISLDTFEARYEPLDGPDGTSLWEYGEVISAGIPDDRVWTCVDSGSDNGAYLLPGWHRANAYGYMVTAKPCLDSGLTVVMEEPTEFDEPEADPVIAPAEDPIPASIRYWNAANEWAGAALEAQRQLKLASREHQNAMMAGLCAQVVETYPAGRWLRARYEWDGFRNQLVLSNVYDDNMNLIGHMPGGSVKFDDRPDIKGCEWRDAFEKRSWRIDLTKMLQDAERRAAAQANRTH